MTQVTVATFRARIKEYLPVAPLEVVDGRTMEVLFYVYTKNNKREKVEDKSQMELLQAYIKELEQKLSESKQLVNKPTFASVQSTEGFKGKCEAPFCKSEGYSHTVKVKNDMDVWVEKEMCLCPTHYARFKREYPV